MLRALIIAMQNALESAVLDNFVTVQPTLVNSGIAYCTGTSGGTLYVYNVSTNACGDTLAAQYAGLATLGLSILNALLSGLLAVEY